MKHVILLAVLLPGISTLATVLGDLAATMQPGEWKELSTQGYVVNGKSILEVNGSSGGGSMTEYSDKAVWNPVTREVWFYGGAHCGGGGCPGSEQIIAYSMVKNAWSVLPNSSKGGGHTYEHNAIDPATGDFYNRAYGASTIDRYRSGAWATYATIPENVWRGQSTCCAGLEYFPERNGLVIVGGGQPFSGGGGAVGFYDMAKKQWSQAAAGLVMGDYSNICGYSKAQRLVFFGGGSSDFYKMEASGSVTKLKNAPITLSTSTTSVGAADPVTGDYLVIGKSGGFYAYSFTADTWRLISNNPPAYGAGQGSDVQIFCSPVPEAGVVLFGTYSFANSKVFIYKHARGTGESASGGKGQRVNGKGQIRISPNPVRGGRAVIAGDFPDASIQIFNAAGQSFPVKFSPLGAGRYRMDAVALAPGIYFVRAGEGRGAPCRRMLVAP